MSSVNVPLRVAWVLKPRVLRVDAESAVALRRPDEPPVLGPKVADHGYDDVSGFLDGSDAAKEDVLSHVFAELEVDGLLPVAAERPDHHYLHLAVRTVYGVVGEVEGDALVDRQLVKGQDHEPLVGGHAVLERAHDRQRHLEEAGSRPEAPRPAPECREAGQREPELLPQEPVAFPGAAA